MAGQGDQGDVMAVVVMHAVASMDGYIADTHDDVGPLFEWYFNGDVEIVDGGPFKVSKASGDYVRPMWQSIGGRRSSDDICSISPTAGRAGHRPANTWWWYPIERSRPGGHPERRAHSSVAWPPPFPRA